MADVQGRWEPKFDRLAELLSDAVDSGADVGASMAVTLEGETVVDLWAGWADPGRTVPWSADTVTNVWSTTKTVTALAALVLVERGVLDLHAPVARYWPEFAANGKEGVEVRHLLSHTSGVSGWEQPVTMEVLYDWDVATAKLAGQAPWWPPGTASGYHALNYGHLIGEVVRRVTGQPLKEFVDAEISGPLGADFQIGLRAEDAGRVSDVIPPPPLSLDAAGIDAAGVAVKTFTGPIMDATAAITPAWRAADIGAANGHGNARSVALVQSVVANGGQVGGTRLLSPATIDHVFDRQSDGVDLVLGVPVRFGVGYALPQRESFPYIPDGRVCFWGGWGGSMVVIDVDRRMVCSYVMNKMAAGIVGSPTSEALIRATYASLA